jgi:hypothetical protein
MSVITRPLRLGHWNVGDRNFREVVARLESAIVEERLDLLALNEVSDQGGPMDQVVTDLAETYGVSLLWPSADLPGARREAILYTDRFEVKQEVCELVMPDRVGDKRAAGAHQRNGHFGPKYVSGAEFHDTETGRTPYVLTTHPVPSVRFPKQQELYNEHASNLAAFLDTLQGLVFLSGDLNANWDSPLVDPLHEAGFTFSQEVLPALPTFGSKTIDHWTFRGDFDLRRQWTVDQVFDHRTLVIAGRITNKKAHQ